MKPGNFPVRSAQSRAAARSLLESRRATQPNRTPIRIRLVGSGPADPNRKCTCDAPPAGTVAICRCFLGDVRTRLRRLLLARSDDSLNNGSRPRTPVLEILVGRGGFSLLLRAIFASLKSLAIAVSSIRAEYRCISGCERQKPQPQRRSGPDFSE